MGTRHATCERCHLRYLFPAGSDENGLSVIFDDGEVLELDGYMMFSTPRISPEGDMVANLLHRPNAHNAALYLFDTNTQTYREIKTDDMQDGAQVPFWADWLDNSHLLVGSAWIGGRYIAGSHVYVYVVEEDAFFRLFERRVQWARVEGDSMVVTYAVAVGENYRHTIYENRERAFPMSEV